MRIGDGDRAVKNVVRRSNDGEWEELRASVFASHLDPVRQTREAPDEELLAAWDTNHFVAHLCTTSGVVSHNWVKVRHEDRRNGPACPSIRSGPRGLPPSPPS